MFFEDPKKTAHTIIGKRDSKGNRSMAPTEVKPEITKMEDGQMDGRHAAMEDFMAAHEEKSPQKMADAMKNFMDIHNSESDSGEPDAS
jgi:hypothetical protein